MDIGPILVELIRKVDETNDSTKQNAENIAKLSTNMDHVTAKIKTMDIHAEIIDDIAKERKEKCAAQVAKRLFWEDIRKKLIVGSFIAAVTTIVSASIYAIKEFFGL